MGFTVSMTVTVGGDQSLFERVPKRLREPRKFLKQAAVLGLSQAAQRLSNRLGSSAGDVTTGLLLGSLNVGDGGGGGVSGGNAHTILEVNDQRAEFGSNLNYAAQKNFGGRISPKPPNKALAIPLDPAIKRSGIGPGEFDPGRDILSFVPINGGASGNVIGLLVDDEGLAGEDVRGKNTFGQALYVLARYVDQEPWLFAGWYPEDIQILREDIWPAFLAA